MSSENTEQYDSDPAEVVFVHRELGIRTAALRLLQQFSQVQQIAGELIAVNLERAGATSALLLRRRFRFSDDERITIAAAVLTDLDPEAPAQAIKEAVAEAKPVRDGIAHGTEFGMRIPGFGGDEGSLYLKPTTSKWIGGDGEVLVSTLRLHASRLHWVRMWIAWEMRTSPRLSRDVLTQTNLPQVTTRPLNRPPS